MIAAVFDSSTPRKPIFFYEIVILISLQTLPAYLYVLQLFGIHMYLNIAVYLNFVN